MSNQVKNNLEGTDYSKSFWGSDAKEAFGMSWKINESGLTRLKRHSEAGFFIVSAFRSGFDFKENMDRMDRLATEIKSAGLGFVQILGKWVEHDKNIGKESESGEISLFVPYEEGYGVKEFSAFAKKLAVTYELEGYFFYSPVDKEIYIYPVLFMAATTKG